MSRTTHDSNVFSFDEEKPIDLQSKGQKRIDQPTADGSAGHAGDIGRVIAEQRRRAHVQQNIKQYYVSARVRNENLSVFRLWLQNRVALKICIVQIGFYFAGVKCFNVIMQHLLLEHIQVPKLKCCTLFQVARLYEIGRIMANARPKSSILLILF